MKMQFWAVNTATAKSRKCHIYLAGGDHRWSFSNSFSIARNQYLFRVLIISYEKLYRKQLVEFPIIEHISLKNQT